MELVLLLVLGQDLNEAVGGYLEEVAKGLITLKMEWMKLRSRHYYMPLLKAYPTLVF